MSANNPNPYQNALDVQNACNLTGVLHSFSRDMRVLCKSDLEGGALNIGTEERNTHPVVLMYLWKLCSLAQLVDVGPVSDLSEAQDLCMERAKTWGIHEDTTPPKEQLLTMIDGIVEEQVPEEPTPNVDILIDRIMMQTRVILGHGVSRQEARQIIDDIIHSTKGPEHEAVIGVDLISDSVSGDMGDTI